MKNCSPALLTALQSGAVLFRCSLYTFTLLGGTVLRYTDWRVNLSVGGHTYTAAKRDSAPGFKCGTTRTAVGLDQDNTELDILYDASTVMQGLTPGAFAHGGGFDGATVSVDTLFMPTPGDTSLGIINRYTGIVDDADVDDSRVKLTVSSRVVMLGSAFPRNYALPHCNYALFDSACTLNKSSFAVSGAVASGPTRTRTQFSTTLGQPNGYFVQGSIVWTSGPNIGITSQVTVFNTGVIILVYPLPSPPNVSDTFTAYPGCDKTKSACNTKFSNLANYGGFPDVPTPETLALGANSAGPPQDSSQTAGVGGTRSGPGGQSAGIKQVQ